MASWGIHLVISKRVNDVIKVDNDLFTFGNLVPDVDNGSNISRGDSHFYTGIVFPSARSEKMININAFLNTYKDKLSNPLILGYYSHLLTDNFFNDYIYSKCFVVNEKGLVTGIKLNNGKIIKIDVNDNKTKLKYKHDDLELYSKYLILNNEIYIPKDESKILARCSDLVPVFVNDSLVRYRIKYLNTTFLKNNKLSLGEKLFKHKYKMLAKDEIDKLIDDCVSYVVDEIKKLNVL